MSEKNTGPVAAVAVTQQGSTFAERRAAREALEAGTKNIDADAVEDKAISRATTKRTASKKD